MEQKGILTVRTDIPFDHTSMMEHLFALCERYKEVDLSYLGESILNRPIPLLTLGKGKRKLLYVGTHRGTEWITAALLTKFALEFCDTVERNGYVGHLHCRSIYNTHTVYVLPMLNPDGVDYHIHGVGEDNPLYERLIQINQGNDFSHWSANARGVELWSNYAIAEDLSRSQTPLQKDPLGESSESEPEVAHLCNFIRYHEDLLGIMTLHTRESGRLCIGSGARRGQSDQVGARLSRVTAFPIASMEGGLTDWAALEVGIPSFSIGCAKDAPSFQTLPSLYARLREALFTFPILL